MDEFKEDGIKFNEIAVINQNFKLRQYLSKHKVDLFEKEDHFGGHSYTIDIEYDKDIKKIFQ